MAYHYIKKPEPISTDEKIRLLSLYSWGVQEIQTYWCLSRRAAIDLRNRIKCTCGTVAFSKTKVLVSQVMSHMDTTIEDQLKFLTILKNTTSGQNGNEKNICNK